MRNVLSLIVLFGSKVPHVSTKVLCHYADRIIEQASQELWKPNDIVSGHCTSCDFIDMWFVLVFGAHTLLS
jgi:hypothetical protein